MPAPSLRIVFMGAPEFAAESLRVLAAEPAHGIVAVVTHPDRPQGRGLKLEPTPVKNLAQSLKLPLLTPPSVKDARFVETVRALAPDLVIVVAFRILPMEVVNLPRLGALNLHASLLPKYRGPAPIQWAVINGERETGVTVFFLNEVVDGGRIVAQERTPIGERETAGELYGRLKVIGARLLKECVDNIAAGRATPLPQEETKATPAPKLKKEDGKIDFSQTAQSIFNRIRGLTPAPGAFALLGGKKIQFLSAEWSMEEGAHAAGRVIRAGKPGIDIQTGLGILRLMLLKPENKKPMTAAEFLNGHPMKAHETSFA